MTNIEVLTVGRISIDLYAEQVGAPLTAIETFRMSIGGTSTNVAVAAARLGHHAATVTRVGDDRFGAYARHTLEHTFGVDTHLVGIDPDLATPLAFAVLDPPDDPTIIFYRKPAAPDMNLQPTDLDQDTLRGVPVLWIPASRFAWEPSRSTVTGWLESRSRQRHTVLDLDWRPAFWDSRESATRHIEPRLELVTTAIGNLDECEIAVGSRDPVTAAERLLDRGVENAIVKLGSNGVLVASARGHQVVAPYPVKVVCGLGAGDAFGGALCHGLLLRWDLAKVVQYANAAGAIVASRLTCAHAMPTCEELDTFIARGPDQAVNRAR